MIPPPFVGEAQEQGLARSDFPCAPGLNCSRPFLRRPTCFGERHQVRFWALGRVSGRSRPRPAGRSRSASTLPASAGGPMPALSTSAQLRQDRRRPVASSNRSRASPAVSGTGAEPELTVRHTCRAGPGEQCRGTPRGDRGAAARAGDGGDRRLRDGRVQATPVRRDPHWRLHDPGIMDPGVEGRMYQLVAATISRAKRAMSSASADDPASRWRRRPGWRRRLPPARSGAAA